MLNSYMGAVCREQLATAFAQLDAKYIQVNSDSNTCVLLVYVTHLLLTHTLSGSASTCNAVA